MPARHSLRIALYAALITTLVACAKHEQAAESSMGAASAASAAPAMETEASAGAVAKAVADDSRRSRSDDADVAVTRAQLSSSAATYTDAQRRFIRTAQAQFRVKDVYQSALAIEDAVAAQGGFVVRNRIGADIGAVQRRPKGDGKLLELAEYTVRGELSVRVPSDKAQLFLRSIANQMEFLDQRNFEAADAQFAMLRQSLAQQRNQQAQLELGDAAGQGGKLGQKIEAIGARGEARSARDEAVVAQKEFEDRVAFATLDLSLYQAARIRQSEVTDVEAVFEQNSPGFFVRLADSLRGGWYGVLEILVQLAKLWPLWLVGAAAVFGWRRLRTGRS